MNKYKVLYQQIFQHDQNKNDYEQISEVVSKKVYLDNKELAVEKIVKVWNNLENGRFSNTSNWTKLLFSWTANFASSRPILATRIASSAEVQPGEEGRERDVATCAVRDGRGGAELRLHLLHQMYLSH